MDDFIHYEELTWPEVEDLPRDVPLVLPLGTGYDLDDLQRQLGNPARIGVLPAFPFGWPGSGIEVPDALLGRYVANLLLSLRAQGFTHAYALAGQHSLPFVESGALLRRPSTGELSPSSLPSGLHKEMVILMPIGHTEQHGLHLPLCVDTLIIDAIAAGTVAAAPERAFSLPVVPYGVSMHRGSFAGTLDAGGRVFEDFWLAVVDSLAAQGFDKFYLMSGHGGNTSFLVNVVKYAGERHPRRFCATAFLYDSGPAGTAALEKHRTSELGGMGHACELETSLMLYLRPDLCHMERVVDEIDFVSTPSYYMEWIEGGPLIANPPWDDDTRTGAYGAGSQGTAEKGQIWYATAIEEKVGQVLEIHEQQDRREARRQSGYGRWAKRRLA